jgi:hypothetical protein
MRPSRQERREVWSAVFKLSVIACVFIAVFAGFGYAIYVSETTGIGSQASDPSNSGAIEACHHFVGDDLKAPSTAHYSPDSEDQVFNAGTHYTVSGYVDAENSFGAKLRLNYTCTVQWHPKKKTWGLVDLSGLGD